MKHFFSLSFILFGLNLLAQAPNNYYLSAEGKSGAELKTALHTIIRDHTPFPYSNLQEQMRYTDEDPNNSNNVILLYTGWSYPKSANGGGVTNWNKEHTWAKSQGNFGESLGPGSDLHHLRPTDVTVNSKRGSLMFDNGGSLYVDPSRLGGGDGNTGCYFDGDSWEAADRVKGDVARMLFYMAVRYENSGNSYYDLVNLELAEYSSTSGLHGKFSTLIDWNSKDTISDWEKRRNNRIFELQKNRNPFIDYPELVDYIWGSKAGTPWYPNGGGGEEPGCQNLNLTAPFTSSMSPFTALSVSGDQQWSWRSAEYGVIMSGYVSSTNYANEDWLISPKINLSEYKNIKLNFDHAINFADINNLRANHSLWISSNYNDEDPIQSIWEEITISNYPIGNNWTFVNSNEILIPDKYWSNDIVFAFKYKCDNQSSSTWEIKNLIVKGDCEITSDIKENIHKKYPISVFYKNITVFNIENEDISIFDVFGRNISNLNKVEGSASFIVQTSGIYVIKIGKQAIKVIVK